VREGVGVVGAEDAFAVGDDRLFEGDGVAGAARIGVGGDCQTKLAQLSG